MHCEEVLFGARCRMTMEKTLKILVEGITCAGCAEDVQTVLGNAAGIRSVSVNYADNIIDITFDPEVIATRDVLLKVNKLGLKTKIVQGSP